MRLSYSLLSFAFLATLVSAAPVDSVALANRGDPGGGNSPDYKKRTCPNGSAGCGEGPLAHRAVVQVREPEVVARGCAPNGGSCANW
ncbi:hypothetical protein LXA43DRAFT_981087 [Ganoderma leucocontextum]|nr:hypothetical protein LXA43DRAFT_981087 [Ganoderma leucocontextum]